MNEQHTRNCPSCKKELIYREKLTLERAIRKNSNCRSCMRKLHSKITVYDASIILNVFESKRPCPKCGKDIIYKSKLNKQLSLDSIKYAIKRNRVCKSCANKMKYHKKGNESSSWQGYEKISGVYFKTTILGAKRRNIKFNITIEDMWNQFLKQNGNCALTGVKLTFSSLSGKNDGTASLDRIDSSKEYTIDNIQWVHKNINYMKMDLNETEFIRWCNKVSEYNIINQSITPIDLFIKKEMELE